MWALIAGSRLPQNEITLNIKHYSEYAFSLKKGKKIVVAMRMLYYTHQE